MLARVSFVGTRRAPFGMRSLTVERWGPREIFRRHDPSPNAIVLFADAIEELDPVTVRGALGPVSSRVVLCLGACTADMMRRIGQWTLAGFTRIVDPDGIERYLEARAGLLRRPEIEVEDWLGFRPAPGSDAERITLAVADLDEFRVELLAYELRRSPRWLQVTCRRALGVSPREAITRYRLALASVGRARGLSVADCAELSRYADGPSWLHALRARADRSDSPSSASDAPTPQGASRD